MIDYPPIPPVHIFIGGQLLQGWTTMNLQRSKKEMTGELSIGVFFGFLPRTPQMTPAVAGKEILVYVGGNLAFTGSIDERTGSGKKGGRKKGTGASLKSHGKGVHRSMATGHGASGGPGISTHIGPDQYTITIKARGKTKNLIDSSHKHPTGQVSNAKTRQVVEELTKPFGTKLEWLAPSADMDKIRFRDGIPVQHEIDRVASEYGLYRYETRDGKLRVTDKAGQGFGEPLILGDNILSFDVSQSEDQANDEINVKGQRSKKEMWGRDAVNRTKKIRDKNVTSRPRPVTVQHYTDASDEALEKRACYEASNRNSASKDIRIEVFHVMPRTGGAWDVGQMHYVEVPTEGIFGPFECTAVNYSVGPDKHLKTQLTLNPAPATCGGASVSGGVLSQFNDAVSQGNARREQLGIARPDPSGQTYPQSWDSPQLEEVPETEIALGAPSTEDVLPTSTELAGPPMRLPDHVMAQLGGGNA